MTIRPGAAWGIVRTLPNDIRILPSEVELHRWAVRHRHAHTPITDVALGSGALRRTCGRSTDVAAGQQTLQVPIDILRLVLDPLTASERTTYATSNVIARRSWWRGEVVLAMNAEFYGHYDVAPRAHPNDGRVDVLRVDPSMTFRQRLAARRRAIHGAHLPHPLVRVSRDRQATLTFLRPLVVWADGVRLGTASALSITVEPDAMMIDL